MSQSSLLVLFGCLSLVASVVALGDCGVEGRVCQNGGVCHLVTDNADQPQFKTPQCVCQHPYAGQYCEYTIRECTDSPCMNGGQCIPASCQPTQSPDEYESVQFDCFRCVCRAGWGGSPFFTNGRNNNPSRVWNAGGICDYPQPHNDCSSGQRCYNGGNCTNSQTLTKNSWSCTCPIEYVGGAEQNCTIPKFNCMDGYPFKIDCANGGTCPGPRQACNCYLNGGLACTEPKWCDVNTCANGGTCVNDGPSTGHCQCTGLDYVGEKCEILKFCKRGLCQNGATCQDTGSPTGITGNCQCNTLPFNGIYCNATKFCASSPCQNGATCVDDDNHGTSPRGGEGSCTCTTPFYGNLCEITPGGCAITGCANGATCPCVDKASCDSSLGIDYCDCNPVNPAVQAYTPMAFADCGCNTTLARKCPAQSFQITESPDYSSQTIISPISVDRVCENGGTCREYAEQSYCVCRTGFWGERCQFFDNPCLNYPCENGGRCRIAPYNGPSFTDRYWGYICNCRYPYYGLNCENRYDAAITTEAACADNKCQNGATCYKRSYASEGGFHDTDIHNTGYTEVGPYACTCAPGYAGIYCDVKLDACDMLRGINPCQNGGQCTQLSSPFNSGTAVRGVECTCKCGYWGYRCEFSGGRDPILKGVKPNLLDFCANNNICQNGGTCFNALDRRGAVCQCPAGWRGLYCDAKARSAATSAAAPSAFLAAIAVIATITALKF